MTYPLNANGSLAASRSDPVPIVNYVDKFMDPSARYLLVASSTGIVSQIDAYTVSTAAGTLGQLVLKNTTGSDVMHDGLTGIVPLGQR